MLQDTFPESNQTGEYTKEHQERNSLPLEVHDHGGQGLASGNLGPTFAVFRVLCMMLVFHWCLSTCARFVTTVD